MTYRRDESKEETIKWLEAKRCDLKRELRTIENSIDWLDSNSLENKSKKKGCGKFLFSHPHYPELACRCGDSSGYFCEECSSDNPKKSKGCGKLWKNMFKDEICGVNGFFCDECSSDNQKEKVE